MVTALGSEMTCRNTGALAFPQNLGYNPTGLIGGLTYMSVKAIRETYLKHPGPLVQA